MNKYCKLAPGLEVSRIITGLWQIADMEKDGARLDLEQTARGMSPYTDAGITSFDMADHYGSAELIAGIFRKKLSNKPIQLLTKWVPDPEQKTKQDVRSAVELSLERMQSDVIDLMQFHAWNYANPYWLDSLFWLQELKEEGLIHNIGLTNFDTAHLRIAISSGVDIVSNQVSYSLIDQRAEYGMSKICEEFDIKLLAFGVLAGGFLSEKWLGAPDPSVKSLSTWSQMKYKRYIDAAGGWEKFQELLDTLQKISKKYHVQIPTIAMKYILDKPSVGSVIIGARLGEKNHINKNMKVFDINLDTDDKNLINKVQEQLAPISGDCGDEYRKAPILTAAGDLTDHIDSLSKPYEPIKINKNRARINSGTAWEELAGYSRAIKKDGYIAVSGTTATHGERLIGGNDPIAQTHFVIDKIEGAIESLGGKLQDVIRTRIFIKNISDWEAVARAHGERFTDIFPANTLVKAELIGSEYLVEIEADAILS